MSKPIDSKAPPDQRLWGMIIKESLQIVRDPSSIAIAFILPVVLLFLFGYGVSLDAKHVPVGLVIEQPDAVTASLSGSFAQSEYFTPLYFHSIQAAEAALDERHIDGIIWLKNNFSKQLLSAKEPPIAVRINGVNSNQAGITQGYIQGVWITWLEQYAKSKGQSLQQAVQMEQRIWFNPALTSSLFLVPGLVAIIMTLIGSMLTSMVVAREWDRGTMEAILVTPLRTNEFLAGKLIPYFILGMGSMLFIVILAIWHFDVPLRGSFWVLMLCSSLFMLVSLAIGLLISIVAKNQFVAGQISIVVTFLPAFMLSGFIFDIHSMPTLIQLITHIVPARYFVAILQTLFLAGDIWPVLLTNMGALLVMLFLFAVIVRKKSNNHLE